MDNNHNNAQMPLHFIGMCDSVCAFAATATAAAVVIVGDDDDFVAHFVSFHFILLFDPRAIKSHGPHNQRCAQCKSTVSVSFVQNNYGNLPTASSPTNAHIHHETA